MTRTTRPTPKKDPPATRLPLRKKLLFAALVLIAALLILEVLMIVLDPVVGIGFYRYDPDMGFRVRAHAHGTNRFGFNDRDYPLEKPAGTYRILIANDSFGWAGGREGNYTEVLEGLLAQRYGEGRVEVINAGYPMTHTGEQLEMLRKYGLQYDPDLVIHGFFVGNDFVAAHRFRKRIVVNDTWIDIDRRHERTLFGYPFVASSRLYHVVRHRLKLLLERFRSAGGTRAGDDPADVEGAFSEQTFAEIERKRMEFCNVRKQKAGMYADQVAFAKENLTGMATLLESRGIAFMVALYPDEFQVDAALQRHLIATFGLQPADYDLDLPNRVARTHLEKLGVPVIDMLEPFREHGVTRRLYLPRNTHWNEAGRQLAGELLFDAVRPFIDELHSSVGQARF